MAQLEQPWRDLYFSRAVGPHSWARSWVAVRAILRAEMPGEELYGEMVRAGLPSGRIGEKRAIAG